MPRLNDNQLKQLADFMANFGLVFFATAVTPVFSAIDNVNPFMIILGLGLTIKGVILVINLDWLKTFYLVGAILILAIAILVYPTLRDRSDSKRRSGKK